MAAVLLALPVEIVGDNPEAQVFLKSELLSYRASQLSSLNLADPTEKLDKGGMRGAEKYSWPGTDSLLLHTAFLLPAGTIQNKEVIRVTTLVRQKDCIHLGSRWEIRGTNFVPSTLNLAEGSALLLEIAKRTFKETNTLKLDTQVAGPFGSRARFLLDAMAAEQLGAQGFPVNTSISRIACQTAAAAPNVPGSSVALAPIQYPARSHRTLVVRLSIDARDPKKNADWPQIKGTGAIFSGIFGDKSTDLFSVPNFENFNPPKLIADMRKAVPVVSHDLRTASFKVLKRKGRWIFLDRGRAFGLEIGMHLQGPGKSEMHIIHFAPGASSQDVEPGGQSNVQPKIQPDVQPDVAVALLRKEDSAAPLKPGDLISIDSTTFPKK